MGEVFMHKRHLFDPPPTPSYSAMHLPDGSLTIFGRKYLLKKKAEEMMKRQKEGKEKKK